MSYIDANGILFLEETDPITPFQVTMNTMQAATSAALVAAVATVPQPKMYAVIGTGTWDLTSQSSTYNSMGPMATWTRVSRGTQSEFTYSSNNPTVNGNSFIANVPGLFRISATCFFNSNPNGLRFLRIVKNGEVVNRVGGPAAASNTTDLTVSAATYLEVGDVLGVQVIQNSGVTLSLSNNEPSRSIIMEYLGP